MTVKQICTVYIFQPNLCLLQCEVLPASLNNVLGLLQVYGDRSFALLRHLISSTAPTGRGSALLKNRNSFLHHSQGDRVRCHRPRLDRNPQVLSIGRIFFLLRLRPCGCHGVSAAAATAAVGMATAAAVAAHHQSNEEDQQGKSQEDHQAHCVVGPLVVFVCSKAPDLVEKIPNTVNFLIHGFRMQSRDSFLIESAWRF